MAMAARSRTRIDRQRIGSQAEDRAARLLLQAGYRIVARNYRCRMGEIDLIAQRADILVIVEVRVRSYVNFGGAAASITAAKQLRLIRTTQHLLAQRTPLQRLAVRFDVILINGAGSAASLEWIEDAFST